MYKYITISLILAKLYKLNNYITGHTLNKTRSSGLN